MSMPGHREPPDRIAYALEEALVLLATLEDRRDALIDSDHFAEVAAVENQIRLLSRRLGFGDPEGGTNAS